MNINEKVAWRRSLKEATLSTYLHSLIVSGSLRRTSARHVEQG
jgi:hypothetical protein